MFEKGGYIVYGTTGVCLVEEITGMKMKGASGEKLYYVLRPCFQKGNTIFTPVDNSKIAMRAVMNKAEAEALVERIPEIEELTETDDKERERLYKEAIKSGKPGEWIRIIKTSYLRSRKREAEGKRATTVDDRYFHTAEEHLYAELAVVLGMEMEDLKLYDAEYRLLEIVWEKEPLSSTELYKECLPRLGWKKSTTYTVLRKLVERKILKNENGAVTALVKKETVQRYESQAVVEKWFDHSLPGFVAAFLGEKKLSREEAEELKQLIDTYQEDGEDMR